MFSAGSAEYMLKDAERGEKTDEARHYEILSERYQNN